MDVTRMTGCYTAVADVDTEMATLETRLRTLADENLAIQKRMNELRDARVNAMDLAFAAIGEEVGLRAQPIVNEVPVSRTLTSAVDAGG